MQIPTPEKKRVWLPSEGINIATLHVYVRTAREPDPEFGDLMPQWAFIFRCAETGAERKYGVQDARPPGQRGQRLDTFPEVL